jgi:hypothetical protein
VPEAAARREPKKERTPRVDWAELLRRTFDFVLAYVKEAGGVRAILEHLNPSHLGPPGMP